ncbi:hypothetical protein HZB60_02675 [candidate division KSB1 bacterium]|nr:hypothetical protein [candidate division KSB1 bacterium]
MRKLYKQLGWYVTIVPLVLTVLQLVSCREKDEEGDTGGPAAIPPALARIHGVISDSSGVPLSDATLRVYYPLTQGGALSEPLFPSAAIFYTEQVLTTQCDNSIPLSDGILVKIFWDANGNGADAADLQPPICPNAPSCEGDGPGYVNINELPINGERLAGLDPGTFYAEDVFNTTMDEFVPNLFYGRIYCADGDVLWTSRVIDLPGGPSEQRMVFDECNHDCNGAPEIPQWSLGQAYPNPATTSATILYSLREAASTLLTFGLSGSGRADTLVDGTQAAGSRTLDVSFSGRANGLYRYALRAGDYSNSGTVIYNIADRNAMHAQPALATSDNNGAYTFDCAAGELLSLRDTQNGPTGVATLTQVRVTATRTGFQDTDTTIAIASSQDIELNLRLRP